jgi:hypothetical protein
MTDDWTWPSRDRVPVRDDDCFGGKAVVPTDTLGAVAKDDVRARGLRVGARPLAPGEAEARASPPFTIRREADREAP